MLTELTRTGRGQAQLVAHGTGPKSWTAWLSEERDPNRSSRERIRAAYQAWFGPGFPNVEQRTHAIHGRVKIGDDERERGGSSGSSPFRANMHGEGYWGRLRDAWRRHASPGVIETLFAIDVVGEIPGLSIGTLVEFPGSSYRVVLE